VTGRRGCASRWGGLAQSPPDPRCPSPGGRGSRDKIAKFYPRPRPLLPFSVPLTFTPSRRLSLLEFLVTCDPCRPTNDYMGKVPVIDKLLEHRHSDIVMVNWDGHFMTAQLRPRSGQLDLDFVNPTNGTDAALGTRGSRS
jgi:hypothetical protein